MPPTQTPSAAITPQGVRDGDPQVLAALVARRGPAVRSFAAEVCEPSYVVRAAADAFARFRAAVAEPSAALDVHPDALLLRCARRAALDLAPRGPDLGCGPAAGLLAARAERTITAPDAALLHRHLETCDHCRELSDRLDAGDRAYREADETPLAAAELAPMVAALAAAAPVRAPSDADGHAEPAAVVAPPHPMTVADEPEPEPEPEAHEEELEPEEDEEEEEEAPEPLRPSRLAYYQLPPLPPRERAARTKKVAKGAVVATGTAASITRRAGAAARRRLQRRAPTASAEPVDLSPELAPEPPRADTTTWQRVEEIEFPDNAPVGGGEPPATVAADSAPQPLDDADMEAARAAARHYRRMRHSQQLEQGPAPTTGGSPPRLPRPLRERQHMPLRAHGRRDLALPAGLLVIAALVILAVAGVFGGGSSTPSTGTQAHAAPVSAPATQSVTATPLADAVRIAAGLPTTAATTP
jgi:hypothetical protein